MGDEQQDDLSFSEADKLELAISISKEQNIPLEAALKLVNDHFSDEGDWE